MKSSAYEYFIGSDKQLSCPSLIAKVTNNEINNIMDLSDPSESKKQESRNEAAQPPNEAAYYC